MITKNEKIACLSSRISYLKGKIERESRKTTYKSEDKIKHWKGELRVLDAIKRDYDK